MGGRQGRLTDLATQVWSLEMVTMPVGFTFLIYPMSPSLPVPAFQVSKPMPDSHDPLPGPGAGARLLPTPPQPQ